VQPSANEFNVVQSVIINVNANLYITMSVTALIESIEIPGAITRRAPIIITTIPLVPIIIIVTNAAHIPCNYNHDHNHMDTMCMCTCAPRSLSVHLYHR
jgi:hypothetical protein